MVDTAADRARHMKRDWQRGVMAGMAVLALGAPAAAQSRPDPRTGAKIHAGPLYATPSFLLKEFGVDTNVFNNAEQKRDFTVTLSPHVDTWVPFGRRGLLTTAVTTDLVYYQVYANQRSFDRDIRMGGEVLLNRITLFVKPSYLRTRQRLNSEIDVRARRRETGVEAGMAMRVGRTLSMEVAGRRSAVRFDAGEMFAGTSLQETLNRETRVLSTAIRHDLTPLTSVALRAEGGVDRFPLSAVRDASTLRVMLGVELRPAALISGSAYVGIRSFTPSSSRVAPFRGIVSNAALRYTLMGSTRFLFTADRDVTYSFEPVEPYFLSHGYGLTVERRLTSRTDVTVGTRRHRLSYRGLLTPGAIDVSPGREDIVRAVSTSFGYRFARAERVGFGIEYLTRRSNSVSHRDYQGVRFTATANYGF